MAPLRCAAKFDPFLSWRNPRKGGDQILLSGNTVFYREELAKKADAERAALTASAGEPDPKKPRTEPPGENAESAAAAGTSSSAADGASKASSEGGAAAGEKTAEGAPAAPVKV